MSARGEAAFPRQPSSTAEATTPAPTRPAVMRRSARGVSHCHVRVARKARMPVAAVAAEAALPKREVYDAVVAAKHAAR